MSKDGKTLLEALVDSSDSPQTLRAQLVEATVVRPAALEEIQRTVMRARDGGTLDEAAATLILNQVQVLVEATVVMGLEPTRLREVPPQKLEEIAAATQRRDYQPTQRISPPARDSQPTQRIEFPPTQRLDARTVLSTQVIPSQAAAVAAAAADATGKASLFAPPAAIPSVMSERTVSASTHGNGVSLVEGSVLKDRFVLKREIGRGGMGAVFAAEDQRKVEANDPEPMVAVKVLAPGFARHPVAFVALQRESRRAQSLAHPNVATVFDFDRDGDLVFMTMELLSGRPLDQVIRETEGKGLERAKALAILIDITRGLAYAHRKGLVHADLKPGNIFLTDAGVPKVLDFGIARAVPGHTVAKKDSFDAGALGAYTPAYATSEMIEGGDPSTADDVYALALIAYELFTGKHPYQRLSGQAAEKRKLKPAPIKGLGRRQWSVIERSLSFNRAQRPVDASAFLKGLFGVTPLQKALIAGVVVLACVAAYFGYARYQAAGPDIPFAALSVSDQQSFRAKMAEGDTAWNFYTQQNIEDAWSTALNYYQDAWNLHPRNREASGALRKLADQVLNAHPDKDEAAAIALQLSQTSPYLKDYGPVREKAPAGMETSQ